MEGSSRVSEFYERHPYPPAHDDIEAYRRAWDDHRRQAESFLFWPAEHYRDDRSILVVGCGTRQAAHYAVRWPHARVVGIDVSAKSLESTLELKRKHKLGNLEVRQLPLESASELQESFEHVVCTGVLHHLDDPSAGLHALRSALAPNGALHLMVYAPYGRAGVYLIQDYCRRLGIGWTDSEIRDLADTLKALPPDHPLVPLLRKSPDFGSEAGVADALLHPRDRSYSVPQLLEAVRDAGLVFGRWVRQAPYLPSCGAIASTPHAAMLASLSPDEQYAALELFRGTMVRHALIAYRHDRTANHAVDFSGDAWLGFRPLRLADTIVVSERLPPGATAVLINRNHSFTDLYLPIDASEQRLLERVDGERSIGQISEERANKSLARSFFEKLWRWDQVVLRT